MVTPYSLSAFPEMEEKWAVVGGDIIAAKYVPKDTEKVMEPDQGMKLITNKEEEKKVETKKVVSKVEVPRSERPKTEVAKMKKAGLPIKEQPPTRRAFMGAVPKAPDKVEVKKGKVLVPMAKPRKKQAKVELIGAPVWKRQLNWKGEPEKINIKEYPIKILCAKCGQPRYIDRKNAGVKDHPVTLCKPHARREHDDRHNAALRQKTEERKGLLVIAAKKALKEAPGTAGKGVREGAEGRKGTKGTPIAPKGGNKALKGRR